MNKVKKKNRSKLFLLIRGLMVVLGGFIAAYGLETVLIPNNVSDGGVTGISIVLSQLGNMPLGILIAIINIPFVWLGYKQIGKSFAIFSIIGIASLAIGTSLMHHIPAIIDGDTLLVTVVGESSSVSGWGLRSVTVEPWMGSTCLPSSCRVSCRSVRVISSCS